LFFTSPWHGCTVVGTTHDHYEDDPQLLAAAARSSPASCEEVNAAGAGFRPEALDDVRSIHLGLTPAEEGESERAKRSARARPRETAWRSPA
jgi:hypothetical protein